MFLSVGLLGKGLGRGDHLEAPFQELGVRAAAKLEILEVHFCALTLTLSSFLEREDECKCQKALSKQHLVSLG